MKKYIKMCLFTLISFFIFNISSFAREMTLEELGEEIINVEPRAGYVYIIGKYAFTSIHTPLTTQDVMLAAKTIDTDASDGYTNDDAIYGKMTIHKIQRIYNEAFETVRWEIKDNLLGDTKLDLSGDKKIDIDYIDYTYIPKKAEIKVDLDKTETGNYKKVIEETYKFTGGNTKNTQNLSLDEKGNLTGLILKNKTVDETVFPNDKTGYYFAFTVEVPNATNDTTIKFEGKNVINASKQNFDEENGLAVLWAIDKENENKKIKITVDLDGPDKDEYGDSTYTIDYSNLTFQEDSSLNISQEVSDNDKSALEKWGYVLKDGEYSLTREGETNKYNLTGNIVSQHTLENVFAKEGEEGYYFVFNLKPGMLTDDIIITTSKKGVILNTYDKSKFGEDDNLTVLFKLNENCEGEDCQFDINVDYDGEGNEYDISSYTINYSGVTFIKNTEYEIEKADESALAILNNNYGFTKPDNYNTEFSKLGDKVTVSGFLPIVDKLTKDNVFAKEHLTGYYLAFVITTDEVATEKTTIKFLSHDNDEEKTITGVANFDDGSNKIYILRHLHPNDTTKTFEIEVDMDGLDEEYVAHKITVDWNNLVLEQNSEIEKLELATSSNISDSDYKEFENWQFDFSKNKIEINEVLNEGNISSYKLTGKVYEQENVTAFSGEAKTGFYVPVSIKVPSEYVDKATFKLFTNKDGTQTKDIPSTEIHDGTLAVLFSIYEDKEDKKIAFQFDMDGQLNEYRPVTYYIDYNDELEFVKMYHATFKYNDGVNEDANLAVYEDEVVKVPETIPTKKYHTFKHWSINGKDEYVANKLTSDIELTPRYDINTYEFVNDAIKNINNDNNLKDKINVSISEENNNIKVKLLKPEVNSTLLTKDVLEGIISHVLSKKEITEFTFKYDDDHKITLADGSTVSTQIEELLKQLHSDNQNITLDDLLNETPNFEIIVTKNIDNVEIVDSAKTYKITFEADYRVVKDESTLNTAITTSNVKNIYLKNDISLTNMLTINEVNKELTIKSLKEDDVKTISTSSDPKKDYAITVQNGTITFENVKITGAKKALLVDSTAIVNAKNVDLSDNTDAGVEVKGKFTASSLKYLNESYINPVVMVEKGSSTNPVVKVDGITKLDTYKEIISNADAKWTAEDLANVERASVSSSHDELIEKFICRKEEYNSVEDLTDECKKHIGEYKIVLDELVDTNYSYYYLTKENSQVFTIWFDSSRVKVPRYYYYNQSIKTPHRYWAFVLNPNGMYIFGDNGNKKLTGYTTTGKVATDKWDTLYDLYSVSEENKQIFKQEVIDLTKKSNSNFTGDVEPFPVGTKIIIPAKYAESIYNLTVSEGENSSDVWQKLYEEFSLFGSDEEALKNQNLFKEDVKILNGLTNDEDILELSIVRIPKDFNTKDVTYTAQGVDVHLLDLSNEKASVNNKQYYAKYEVQ